MISTVSGAGDRTDLLSDWSVQALVMSEQSLRHAEQTTACAPHPDLRKYCLRPLPPALSKSGTV